MKIFVPLRWLLDVLIFHTYFYKEPPKWTKGEQWVSFGMKPKPVTKKQCKSCDKTFWSNNKVSLCGNIICWFKYY